MREVSAILPVFDLLGGQVVRGVAGRRKEYRPVQSRLCDSAQPADVARAMVGRFGFNEAYVADLDAIAGRAPDWAAYDAIAEAGLRLWIDAGIGSVKQAEQLLGWDRDRRRLARLVAGLESIPTPDDMPDLMSVCGSERVVFSLDLKAGKPLTSSSAWQGQAAEEIAELVIARGVRNMILLDLANVGMYEGTGTEALCRTLRERFPQVQFIGGGGVRSRADVERLCAAGFERVLVASALHDGRIAPEEISR
jgi:phosphoribosylformimino-5-aminoimidazole carboxamide ribotide isomerase